jgi:geranylgeranyl reductase family protein
MDSCDVLIVGGGPAGSSCARALVAAGMDVIVIDRARFPRNKLCAGWVTPRAFTALQLTPGEYARSGAVLQEIRGFATGLIGGRLRDTRYDSTVSYGVRRCEFDTFLLRRSGARVMENTPLTSLHRVGDGWVVNDAIHAAAIVGAGGHFCPVAAHVGRASRPHALVVAQEAEFRLPRPGASPIAPDLPELFFCRDVDGYGWCFRKGDYLNVGIGRRTPHLFAVHARAFRDFLIETGRIDRDVHEAWRGHAYILAGGATRLPYDDGVVLVGDAAGLAVPESGEGIRTAIESAIVAAEVLLAAGGRYTAEALQPYAARVASAPARRGAAAHLLDAIPAPLVRAAARQLLKSRAFTRRIVIDRWFLQQQPSA